MVYSKLRGYNISRLTLGTVALGMHYGISNKGEKPGREQSFRILSTALNAGINTLDTARGYGESEELIGGFLGNAEMNEPVNVVTKFRIAPENVRNIEKTRAEVYDQVRASTSLLQLKCIPICLFHMSRRVPLDDVLEVLPSILCDLKSDGLIDVAGVSIDHPDEASSFIEIPSIEAMQIPLNLFDTRLVKNGILNRLHTEGKIVFVRSVFLQGLFFMNPAELQGNLKEAAQYLGALQEIAKAAEMSIAQLAFSYINNLQGITSIVFGAINEEQVKQNIWLAENAAMSNEIAALVQSKLDAVPEHIFTPGLWSLT